MRAPGGGMQVPTLSAWESRSISGNCPTPRSIEVERTRASGQLLVAPRSLAALMSRVSRTMSLESLAQGTELSRTLE
jgi:hypothetical protein